MRTFAVLTLLALSLFQVCAICRADERGVIKTKDGVVIDYRTYIDPASWASSRFDMAIKKPDCDNAHWDFTIDRRDDPDPLHYTGIGREQSLLPYRKRKFNVVHATLWEYETLDETVTFHNLDLYPIESDPVTKYKFNTRVLSLNSPLAETTPSGIQVTLPVQEAHSWSEIVGAYDGPAEGLFIRISVSSNSKNAVLPKSPLYEKYHKPIQIYIGQMPDGPALSDQRNNYLVLVCEPPPTRETTHLNTLTFLVRQRVNLKAVPIAIKMPIDQ